MKQVIKNLIIIFAVGVIWFIIGYFLSIPLSEHFDNARKDMLFYEGIIITCIFLWFSIQGSSSLTGMQGLGKSNAQAYSYRDIETLRVERESGNYIKNFMNNNVLNMGFISSTVVVGGILMLICSMFWM